MRFKASFFLLVSNIFFATINIFIYYLAIQQFIPKKFGYLAVASSFFAFYNFFSDLGLSITHVKKMAEKRYSPSEYFTISLVIKVFLLLLNTLVFYIILNFQFPKGRTEDTQLYVLNVFFLTTAIQSFNLTYKTTFQAQMNFVKMQISLFTEKITNGIIQLIAILILHNFGLFVLTNLISSIVGVSISIILSKDLKLVKINKKQIADYSRFSFFVNIPSLFTLFINNFGIFIFLKYFDESLLGVFYVINITLAFIYIFEQSISMILLPDFSSLKMNNNYDKIQEILRFYEKYVLIFWSFLVIGGFIFLFYIIDTIYGIYYASNGIIYLLMTIFFLFNWALLNPYKKFLIATSKLKLIILTSSIELILSIICWFLLIPKYNIVALRLGTFVSSFINIIIIRTYLRKKFSFNFFEKKSILLIIFNFFFGTIYCIFFSIYNREIISLILQFLISISIFTIFLFIFKIISMKEIKEIYKQIKPKSMINYFRTQI